MTSTFHYHVCIVVEDGRVSDSWAERDGCGDTGEVPHGADAFMADALTQYRQQGAIDDRAQRDLLAET